ncbi:MAG: hemolysin XhlA family protein [Cyanobacteriota bacterium]|nr:hemolysin XhlA family protein [Cyanobacteriota bacterium]
MSNISIETDLKEIIGELKQGQNKIIDKIETIDKKVEAIDKRLIKVETKLDSELPAMQKSIDEIKGSQQAQIWTLIGILITAVAGFLVAVGRFVFSGNP